MVEARSGRDPLLRAMAQLAEQLEQPLTLGEIEAASGNRQERLTAFDLKRLAERLGYRAAVSRASRRHLRDLRPPYILTSKDGATAWVVRERQGERLIHTDTARDLACATPIADLVTRADMAISLRIARESRKQGQQRPDLWRDVVWRRLRPALGEIGLASVVINLLALATPIFMMTVYNKVINHAALQTLDVLMVGMMSLIFFELILRTLRGYITTFTGAKLDAAIGSEVMHHMLRLPYRVFEAMPTAQMLERLRQIDQLRLFLTSNLPLLLVDLAFVGLFVTAVFMLAPPLGWITLAALPIFVLLSILAQHRQQRLSRQNFREAAAKSAVMGEAISQALTVKGLGLEAEMERRFEARLLQNAQTGLNAGRASSLVASLGQALQHLAAIILVYVGARLIVAGELNVGALVASTILAARALAPMRQIAFAWHQFQQAREAFSRLEGLMGEQTEALKAGADEKRILRGSMGFDGVSFAYGAKTKSAVEGITFQFEPGTMLGIVGPSGSGKTTLIKLMLGLEVPTAGKVTMDGFDLRQLPAGTLRSQVGFVPQDVQLFAGTIAENIGMASSDRAFSRIVAAARFVGLHEFVESLPDGYDSVLGERGSGLSSGQRQLICIARALVRNPKILVLDEVTSALDPASEEHLLKNLRRASKGRTIVLVTHRRSTLAMCNAAIALSGGRIVAKGAPRDVLATEASVSAPHRPQPAASVAMGA